MNKEPVVRVLNWGPSDTGWIRMSIDSDEAFVYRDLSAADARRIADRLNHLAAGIERATDA